MKNYDSEVQDTALISYQTDWRVSVFTPQSIGYSSASPVRFEIELNGPVGVVSLGLLGESRGSLPSIYVEKGDTVMVSVTGKGRATRMHFVGLNKERFQISGRLDSIATTGQYLVNHSKSEMKYPINLKTMYYRFRMVKEDKLKLLEGYKNILGTRLYGLYKADIEGVYQSNSNAQGLTFLQQTGFEPYLYPVVEELLKVPVDTVANNAELATSIFLKGLRERLKLEFAVGNKRMPNTLELFMSIKTQLSGRWREKEVLYFMNTIPKGSPEDFDTMTDEALKIISHKEDKTRLIALVEARKAGKKAYDFSLADAYGKTIRLSDFKGKTVVLDFWFTGCQACLLLSKMMEKDVLPLYKNNSGFVYITISIDKNILKWKSSIALGQYTRADYINLYTDNQGYGHPVIEQYQVKGFPTLIIIDKSGKIVSSNIEKKASDIIKYINQAL
ncbi:TlpA family protein disulfide reductase [Chryseobacterium sp. 52]|uniref:TlpA family protein disulfide reductase n=1 Tax=Chryseobacterium sp. 52 TaxID=2035213 RepID=UPI0015D4ED77|nr:TlpA disulfide reductase family protein [Chryseobacterium sp. 52]